jgi:putative addiction module component (TIGR02574 family)
MSRGKPALNIDDLSVEERLHLLDQLWDSLRETPGAVPLTDAQREELDRRLDDLERSGPEGIPWEEVLRQIRKRSK